MGAAIGNSLGGYLCMHAALRERSLFSRLVNVHSPGVPEPRLWALRAALSVPGVAELLPGVRLVWLDESSHFAHVDSPTRLLESVLEFLEASG